VTFAKAHERACDISREHVGYPVLVLDNGGNNPEHRYGVVEAMFKETVGAGHMRTVARYVNGKLIEN